uniref:Uncharacterized protein n=1 Tax=Oryza brachyantha TaxID=4533 RepID=J3LK29_ORYBR
MRLESLSNSFAKRTLFDPSLRALHLLIRFRAKRTAAVASLINQLLRCSFAPPAADTIVMASSSPYAPHLTRWRVAAGGVVLDCVEYEGKPLFLPPEEDTRERLEIAGEVFPLMDETMVPVLDDVCGGVKAARCVEYSDDDDDGAVLLLTVTEGKRKEVAEVDPRDGEVRVVGCGGYYDGESGTVQHVVDVQGEREAYMLLVSVREELGRIVRIKRLN